MKTLTEMTSNVGNMVQDTSTSLATLIKVWLNDGYVDVWRRGLWSEAINNDYTFACVSAQQSYDLPLDFEDEIFVSDITDGIPLARNTEGNWWMQRTEAYSGGSINQGTSSRYVILKEKLNSTHAGFGVIMLDPTPNNTHTIAMPYKRKPRKLISLSGTCTTDTLNKIIASASTFITSGVQVGDVVKNTSDTTYGRVASVDSETQLTMDWDVCPDGNETFELYTYPEIQDAENIIECYAISQAEAYKKQYQKAAYWGNRYEQELNKRIGQNQSKLNQVYQFVPRSRGFGATTPFTGWNSYDSI